MTDSSFALQTAVYAALTTPALAEVSKVVDHPITDPQASDFPFVQIGDEDYQPDDTDDGGGDGGVGEFITVHVWSRYRGKKQAKAICSEIYDRLHGASLTVTGRASALCWVRSRLILNDPDGLTRHGVVNIEIIHRS